MSLLKVTDGWAANCFSSAWSAERSGRAGLLNSRAIPPPMLLYQNVCRPTWEVTVISAHFSGSSSSGSLTVFLSSPVTSVLAKASLSPRSWLSFN
jgi:hypothetical protein